ncbi:STAS domain-containing protein (plasmid) [Rhizobium leguminosarum]|nr:STAS domain-containing protein [Rhizobium leguminosarum]
MLHLSKPSYLRQLFLRSRWSFANVLIVIAGELILGVPQGIALGVVLSLLTLIYLVSHPLSAELGQVPGVEAYRDVERHPDARTFDRLLIWRAGGDLFFATIGRMAGMLKEALSARPEVRCALLDFSSVNFIDVTAVDGLSVLIKDLRAWASPSHSPTFGTPYEMPCGLPGLRNWWDRAGSTNGQRTE